MITLLLSIGSAGLSAAGVMKLWQLDRHLVRFEKRKYYSNPTLMKDLPSVSICIPARNEYQAMSECLQLALASRYPKIEIIVIDDESVDSTPQLIKSFAHEGVRFIQGGDIPDGWLGKNHAINTLLHEANGTYVIFMDVDTKFSPDTVGQFVSYMTHHRLSMMSALPLRRDVWRGNALFAPLRYFWRIMFHSNAHPISASSAWMVNRQQFMDDFKDMEPLRSVVEPEVDAARFYLVKKAYRFLIGNELLGLSYEKRMSSQFETSIRLRYPMLHFSVARAFAATVTLILYAAFPLIGIVWGLFAESWLLVSSSILLYLVEVFAYYIYLKRAWPRHQITGALLIPIVLCEDVYITTTSTWRYLRHKVTWKGRPIEPDTTRRYYTD